MCVCVCVCVCAGAGLVGVAGLEARCRLEGTWWDEVTVVAWDRETRRYRVKCVRGEIA